MTNRPDLQKQDQLVLWIHFLLILVIYGSTAYYSAGFDDEYFNIMVVERFGTGIAGYTQTTDVHPPLSYWLNAWLFKWMGQWEWVRLVSGLLTAGALIATIRQLSRKKGLLHALVLIYLLALNPAILMWGTSLRWYGYFFPILIWLFVIPQNPKWHWPKFFFSFLLMGYIGYISFFIFPALFWYYWLNDERASNIKLKSIVLPALIALLAYLPQLVVFFRVHYPRSGGQVFSLPSGLIGIFSTHFSNQGVFPLSLAGIGAAIGSTILFLIMLIEFRSTWKKPFLGPFMAGEVILLLSRIAGKMRNLSVMMPLQMIGFANRIHDLPSKWTWIAAGLISYGNLVGTYNVILHEDTTKNSWNLPVDQVRDFVVDNTKTARSAVLIYCHDPILTLHFEKLGYPVRSPYAHQPIDVEGKKFSQVVVMWTHPGYIPKQRMDLYHFEIDLMKRSSKAGYVFGIDKYAAFKRRKEPQYPDELIKVELINNPDQIAVSSVWSPVFVNRFK